MELLVFSNLKMSKTLRVRPITLLLPECLYCPISFTDIYSLLIPFFYFCLSSCIQKKMSLVFSSVGASIL